MPNGDCVCEASTFANISLEAPQLWDPCHASDESNEDHDDIPTIHISICVTFHPPWDKNMPSKPEGQRIETSEGEVLQAPEDTNPKYIKSKGNPKRPHSPVSPLSPVSPSLNPPSTSTKLPDAGSNAASPGRIQLLVEAIQLKALRSKGRHRADAHQGLLVGQDRKARHVKTSHSEGNLHLASPCICTPNFTCFPASPQRLPAARLHMISPQRPTEDSSATVLARAKFLVCSVMFRSICLAKQWAVQARNGKVAQTILRWGLHGWMSCLQGARCGVLSNFQQTLARQNVALQGTQTLALSHLSVTHIMLSWISISTPVCPSISFLSLTTQVTPFPAANSFILCAVLCILQSTKLTHLHLHSHQTD